MAILSAKERFLPYMVMAAVILMYAVKVIVKISVGNFVNSPVITGDGYHNASDILEAVLVITVIMLAQRPPNWKYPFGRKNVESIFELAVGLSLTYLAFRVLTQSLGGLLAYFPLLNNEIRKFVPLPEHETLLMGQEYFWWVLGTMAGSAILSVIASTIQIKVGKSFRHKSLVADGQETRSDGVIEFTAVAGILGEYSFNMPVIEYILGLGVTILLARTAFGLIVRGWRTLLQRSIGKEHEEKILDIVQKTYGVVDMAELKTFKIGAMPVLIMKVTTRSSAETALDIKSALAGRIHNYMAANEFPEWDYYIRFDKPIPHRYRISFAVISTDAGEVIAPSIKNATHFRVCDIEDEKIVRWKDYAVPPKSEARPLDGPPKLSDAFKLLKDRRVKELQALDEESTIIAELQKNGINYNHTPTHDPALLGISKVTGSS